MSAVTVDCNKFENATTACTTITLAGSTDSVCKEDASGANCLCNDQYGATNTACTKDTLKCTDLGETACGGSSDCKFVDKTCVCNPDKHFVADSTNLGFCVCDAGYGPSTSGSPTPCAACADKQFNGVPGLLCKDCPSGQKGAPTTTGGGNTHCICENTTQGIFGNDKKCVACNGEGQSINATNGNCECTEGYTQDATTGACSKSSSASPLAIIMICALIISIIASIATAAVMIRRKANNARAAEAIVSDAL